MYTTKNDDVTFDFTRVFAHLPKKYINKSIFLTRLNFN